MELPRDYFEKNLSLLKVHHPQVWEKVKDFAGEPRGEFCLTEDGNPNLLVRRENGEEIFLHNTKAPHLDLTPFYRLVPEDATGVVVFVGMGLGYAPLSMILSRHKMCHLAVLEPETGIFVRALHAVDLTPLFSDRRVVLAIGPEIEASEAMKPMERALQLESIHILTHAPSFQIDSKPYQLLHEKVYKHGNTFNIGGSNPR